jgi:hydroxymethylglutaryl-CoA lyase
MDLKAISLADTVGLATPQQIADLVGPVLQRFAGLEIGVHMHGRPGQATDKVLAAYNAGCRRFDSAIGGLGGCPFAQDVLVGNLPTEVVMETLRNHGASLPPIKLLTELVAMSSKLADQFGGPKM